MNLTAVLVTGLFAGGLSCAAVQGGLLAGLVTRQRRDHPPGPARSRLVDDLAPVGGFLAGKLVSHTALGAVLGAVGSVVQLSVGVRTMAQLVAGAAIIVFGLAQLGVPGLNRLVIEPPAAWSRFVRGRARSQSMFAPTVLGFATVAIPCGVTLSVEALALASGSVWSGAAIMAVFVIGTGPLFAVLGYVARRAATAWRGRLGIATGLVIVALGLYTFNGGLELTGSPLAASNLARAAGHGAAPVTAAPSGGPRVTVEGGRQTVVVTAHTGAYVPENLAITAGIPTTLIVRSENATGCVRAFVIPALGRDWMLPVTGDTTIDLGTPKAGRLDYSCGMGMYTGSLTVRPATS